MPKELKTFSLIPCSSILLQQKLTLQISGSVLGPKRSLKILLTAKTANYFYPRCLASQSKENILKPRQGPRNYTSKKENQSAIHIHPRLTAKNNRVYSTTQNSM